MDAASLISRQKGDHLATSRITASNSRHLSLLNLTWRQKKSGRIALLSRGLLDKMCCTRAVSVQIRDGTPLKGETKHYPILYTKCMLSLEWPVHCKENLLTTRSEKDFKLTSPSLSIYPATCCYSDKEARNSARNYFEDKHLHLC